MFFRYFVIGALIHQVIPNRLGKLICVNPATLKITKKDPGVLIACFLIPHGTGIYN